MLTFYIAILRIDAAAWLQRATQSGRLPPLSEDSNWIPMKDKPDHAFRSATGYLQANPNDLTIIQICVMEEAFIDGVLLGNIVRTWRRQRAGIDAAEGLTVQVAELPRSRL